MIRGWLPSHYDVRHRNDHKYIYTMAGKREEDRICTALTFSLSVRARLRNMCIHAKNKISVERCLNLTRFVMSTEYLVARRVLWGCTHKTLLALGSACTRCLFGGLSVCFDTECLVSKS